MLQKSGDATHNLGMRLTTWGCDSQPGHVKVLWVGYTISIHIIYHGNLRVYTPPMNATRDPRKLEDFDNILIWFIGFGFQDTYGSKYWFPGLALIPGLRGGSP